MTPAKALPNSCSSWMVDSLDLAGATDCNPWNWIVFDFTGKLGCRTHSVCIYSVNSVQTSFGIATETLDSVQAIAPPEINPAILSDGYDARVRLRACHRSRQLSAEIEWWMGPEAAHMNHAGSRLVSAVWVLGARADLLLDLPTQRAAGLNDRRMAGSG